MPEEITNDLSKLEYIINYMRASHILYVKIMELI